MGKTIYEKIKFGRSQSTPLKNNTEVSDWEASDKTLQNSAGDLLSNPEQRTITIPGQEVEKLAVPGTPEYDKWLAAVTADPSIEDKYKPSISTEYRGDLAGSEPDMETSKTTTTEVTPERKRYNPGYYETVNRNMAEAAARRGSRRDTRRALRDLKKGLTREQKRELNENRSKLRSEGKLKGGVDRKIQLLQSITKGGGVEGSENFGNRGADAARGKLDKTSKSYQSKLEGDTMDKSAGQLGNVQDKVTMEEAKTVTNVTETSKPIPGTETPGQENVPGVVVTNNEEGGPQKNKYGKNKSPFKMGGPGSRARGNYTPYNK
jgi:hypothetical protein